MKVHVYRALKPEKGIPHSRPTLRKLMAAGEFPMPIHLSERCEAWIDDELDQHLEAKRAKRDGVAT